MADLAHIAIISAFAREVFHFLVYMTIVHIYRETVHFWFMTKAGTGAAGQIISFHFPKHNLVQNQVAPRPRWKVRFFWLIK